MCASVCGMCICECVYVYMWRVLGVCVYMCECISVCGVCIPVCVYLYVGCVYVCMCVSVCGVCVCVYMYAGCVCVCVCVCGVSRGGCQVKPQSQEGGVTTRAGQWVEEAGRGAWPGWGRGSPGGRLAQGAMGRAGAGAALAAGQRPRGILTWRHRDSRAGRGPHPGAG